MGILFISAEDWECTAGAHQREVDMKMIEDCVRRMVPGHWITEVEASACDVNMLAYPALNSRYTLVVGVWMALLDGGHEVKFEGFASIADAVESLERDDRTVAPNATNEQLSMDF